MRRREFIAGLLFAATAQRVQAQRPAQTRRIVYAHPAIPAAELRASPFGACLEELGRLGYVEGRNLAVELFSTEGKYEHFAKLARDLVASNPDVILTSGWGAVRHFRSATSSIPIVALMGDPVRAGIVASMARPGGNITGVTLDAGMGVHAKRLGLVKEVIPGLTRMSFLATHGDWKGIEGQAARETAEQMGVSLVGALVDAPVQEADYRRTFSSIAGVDAILVSNDGENFANRRLIVELVAKARLPTMFPWREPVELGGLMAYAPDLRELWRHGGKQIDQILKGTSPGEIPVYQATKLDFIINLKTANTLGLTVPPTLLATADKVIE